MEEASIRTRSLILVSPPFMRPLSPPLGPASLKAFLHQELPMAEVKCIDLNLEYFYLALQWLESGMIKLRLYDWDDKKTAIMVKKAFEFLRTTAPRPENIDGYHRQATVFLSFENIFNAFISEMAIRFIVGAPVPASISSFLHRLCSTVLESAADVVGISVMFDIQMPLALLMAKKVKDSTGAWVILGGAKFGVEPSYHRLLSEPVTKKVRGIEYRCQPADFIDGIISGEGEVAILHILRSKNRFQMEQAPNLSFNNGERIVHNKPAVIDDLDRLPCPDFSDFSLQRYLCPEEILPLLTARGCPWGRCAFCTHHRSYKRYRQRSIPNVVRDFKYLRERYGVRIFNIYDEMIPPGRFRALAKELIKGDLDICYSAYGKPVRGFTDSTLGLIRKSGCGLILWGLESASQSVLDLMNKGTKISEVERVLKSSAKQGIKNLVFVMFGFPGESEAEFMETINFLEKNRPAIHALSKGLFRLTEGCRVHNDPEAFGITDIEELKVQPFKAKHLIFNTSTPLDPAKAEGLFRANLRRIEAIGITSRFGTYREHLLIYACQEDRSSSFEIKGHG